jgi:hypothetical protein
MTGCAASSTSDAAAPEHPPPAMQATGELDDDLTIQPREPQETDARRKQYQDKPLIEAPSKPPIFSHKVKWPQETLYSIALWYTGSGNHWKQIAAANPFIDPDRIHIGDTIVIPPSLIKTRRSMPSGFLIIKKKTGERPAVKRPSTSVVPSDPPPLFGPIAPSAPRTPPDDDGLPEKLETLE